VPNRDVVAVEWLDPNREPLNAEPLNLVCSIPESAVARETALPLDLDEFTLAFRATEAPAAVPPERVAIVVLPALRPAIELADAEPDDAERPALRAAFDATLFPLPKECHRPSGVLRLIPAFVPARLDPRLAEEPIPARPVPILLAPPP
jgi:hypothetical protein